MDNNQENNIEQRADDAATQEVNFQDVPATTIDEQLTQPLPQWEKLENTSTLIDEQVTRPLPEWEKPENTASPIDEQATRPLPQWEKLESETALLPTQAYSQPSPEVATQMLPSPYVQPEKIPVRQTPPQQNLPQEDSPEPKSPEPNSVQPKQEDLPQPAPPQYAPAPQNLPQKIPPRKKRVPQTPVPQTPVSQTPVPQTPVPQTPAPQNVVPQNVVPQKPVQQPPAPQGVAQQASMQQSVAQQPSMQQNVAHQNVAQQALGQQTPRQHNATPPLGQPTNNRQANPNQPASPYPSVAQQNPYGSPYNSYNYAYAHQAQQNQKASTKKKWSTAALIISIIVSLLLGALVGGGIVAGVSGITSASSLFGHSKTQDSSVTANSSGVILINSELNRGIAAGTGMVISSDGYAVTNYHVVEGSTAVKVILADTGEKYTANVIGHDAAVDLAVLKLENANDMPYIKFDTSDPKKGEKVYALGNANGQGYLSQLNGEITALNQNLRAELEGGDSEKLLGLIETDADLVPGCSGGPMYNSSGQVIGVVVAASYGKKSEDIYGYAIPAKDVVPVIEQIKTGKSKGTTRVGPNGALGIIVSDGDDGVYVEEVASGSAAADAGIQAGDSITAVNGKSVYSANDLSKLIKGFDPEDTVKITYTDSSGKEKTVKVTLGESSVN